jgi:predicted flap endonuclease-1-like 5' DNA nuclease
VVDGALKICRALGYDMNTVEFALKDGVPYAIDFTNPAPDFDVNSLTPHYFDWVVKTMADYTIELALQGRTAPSEYTWSQLIGAAAPAAAPAPAAPAAPAAQADDLIVIDGIGPVMAKRLNAAGITTFAQLAAMTPDAVQAAIGETRAPINIAAWIAEAAQRAQGAAPAPAKSKRAVGKK